MRTLGVNMMIVNIITLHDTDYFTSLPTYLLDRFSLSTSARRWRYTAADVGVVGVQFPTGPFRRPRLGTVRPNSRAIRGRRGFTHFLPLFLLAIHSHELEEDWQVALAFVAHWSLPINMIRIIIVTVRR
jgi:hypothetical protein